MITCSCTAAAFTTALFAFVVVYLELEREKELRRVVRVSVCAPSPSLPILFCLFMFQMNGADPYSALHNQQQAGPSPMAAGGGTAAGAVAQAPAQTPASAAAAAAEQRAATGAAGVAGGQQCGASFPILDKHAKPLVGSDTAKAVRFDAAGEVLWLMPEHLWLMPEHLNTCRQTRVSILLPHHYSCNNCKLLCVGNSRAASLIVLCFKD